MFKMTMGVVLAWTVTLGLLAVIISVLVRIALLRRQARTLEAEDYPPFSLERYKPMERLLADDDLVFLKVQPGYSAEMGRRWKRERRRIFRLYLKELKSEFRRLHAQARRLAADGHAGAGELVEVLWKQQVLFLRTTISIEIHWALHLAGLGNVDVRKLIDAIESMRLDVAGHTQPLTA